MKVHWLSLSSIISWFFSSSRCVFVHSSIGSKLKHWHQFHNRTLYLISNSYLIIKSTIKMLKNVAVILILTNKQTQEKKSVHHLAWYWSLKFMPRINITAVKAQACILQPSLGNNKVWVFVFKYLCTHYYFSI